jgi:hypothetical protein
MMAFWQEHFGDSYEQALAKLNGPLDLAHRKRILDCPPEQVTWLDLHTLADQDPDAAAQRWEEIKTAALQELRSGHRAASTVEATSVGPWDRARFLAIREEFGRDWRPRNGIERMLIDVMAQAHTAYLFWQERLTLYSALEPSSDNPSAGDKGTWNPPRVTESHAMDQAAAMADRFHRMFVRSLRALRDLRRYSPAVVVQNARQVNVGEKQVNVAGGGSPG